MSVSANVLGDVHVKVARFKEFAKELTELVAGNGRETYKVQEEAALIAQFLVALQGRVLEGGLKYGPGSWKHVDLMEELKQELLDVAGYPFLELLKNPDANDMHQEWLMSMATIAFVLWKEVNALD